MCFVCIESGFIQGDGDTGRGVCLVDDGFGGIFNDFVNELYLDIYMFNIFMTFCL